MRWRRAGTGLGTLHAGHRLLLDECRSTIAKNHTDLPAFLEPSSNHLFGKWIADRALNCPAHRSGPVERFVAFFNQPLLDVVLDLELHSLVEETKVEFTQEDVENAVEMRLVQLMKDHDLVDPVQKLRAERAAQFPQHFFLLMALLVAFRALESEGDSLLDHLSPDIGGHNDDAILEVNFASEAVGQHPVVQYL